MPSIDAEPALRYAVLGLPVFPCQPGGKTPATGQGFKEATTDTGRAAGLRAGQRGAAETRNSGGERADPARDGDGGRGVEGGG
jgi:hypothetical protein